DIAVGPGEEENALAVVGEVGALAELREARDVRRQFVGGRFLLRERERRREEASDRRRRAAKEGWCGHAMQSTAGSIGRVWWRAVMTIRPATPADVPAVLPMVAKLAALHEKWDPARYDYKPNTAEMYRRWLSARATDANSVFLVADHER